MSIYNSLLWISDLDEVIEKNAVIAELEGKSVFITGASGLVCSAVIDVLIRYNETHHGKITILAAGRDRAKLQERFDRFFSKDYFIYVPYDSTSVNTTFGLSCDYVIHGASNASPRMIATEPVETMLSNFWGLKVLLDHVDSFGTKRLLFVSSSEIYGKKEGDAPYREDDYGFIDLLNSRNSYSVSKRAAETLCRSYYDEYGVDTVIVRPGHIYGPTASFNDNRVSSAWARIAARSENIIMKSDGTQIRSYCYCLDCATAILTVLLKGKTATAYNVSNPGSVITIREMGEIIADAAGVELLMETPTLEDEKGFNPMNNSSLESTALQELGWKGLFDAKRGFEHTIEIMKDVGNSKEQ